MRMKSPKPFAVRSFLSALPQEERREEERGKAGGW
jgi:hypothetical protein